MCGIVGVFAYGRRGIVTTEIIDGMRDRMRHRGPDGADRWGREALFADGEKIGRLTSGGYSVAFGKQIGMGYVRPDLAEPGTRLKLRMFREFWDAEVTEDSPFDPQNERIRMDG